MYGTDNTKPDTLGPVNSKLTYFSGETLTNVFNYFAPIDFDRFWCTLFNPLIVHPLMAFAAESRVPNLKAAWQNKRFFFESEERCKEHLSPHSAGKQTEERLGAPPQCRHFRVHGSVESNGFLRFAERDFLAGAEEDGLAELGSTHSVSEAEYSGFAESSLHFIGT